MADNKLIALKQETVDQVAARVKAFQENGEIFFPANYSPDNALKSAWLAIQETQNKDHRPALEICSKDSISNSLLSMVIQGLNPDKKQCYFIVYGTKLQMLRSYFGSMAVAKQVDPDIEEICPEVVYEGDEFEYNKFRGKTTIARHTQRIENVKKDKIKAAYCMVLYKSGAEETTIMTFDEIKQAWAQSKTSPIDAQGNVLPTSTHGKFTAEMCKKTVVNKACKLIINSSNDSSLLAQYARQTETDIVEGEVDDEVNNKANKKAIDFIPLDTPETAAEPYDLNQDELPDILKDDIEEGPLF